MNRELLQQALDMINAAIKSGDWKVDGACDPDSLIRGLKAELALDRKADNARELGLDYEPVAYYWRDTKACYWIADIPLEDLANLDVSPLYTAPPRKEWVGLTSEDWENLPDTGKQGCERDAEIFDWIEAKLKEKNNA